jgi:hypothetical protein
LSTIFFFLHGITIQYKNSAIFIVDSISCEYQQCQSQTVLFNFDIVIAFQTLKMIPVIFETEMFPGKAGKKLKE